MIATSTRPRGFIVDCDIHQPDPLNEEFAEYLPEPYKSEIATFGPRKLFSGHRFEDGGMRWDLRREINGKGMDCYRQLWKLRIIFSDSDCYRYN